MIVNPNPYSPPESEVASLTSTAAMVDAGKGRRFGTFVVDYIGFMACGFGFGILLAVVFREDWERVFGAIPETLWGVLILSAYYLFFEGIWSRTPGKLIFGTRVVTLEGTTPSFGQVVKRTLCRFIPFEPFSFFGARGWHDSISKTRVVRTKA